MTIVSVDVHIQDSFICQRDGFNAHLRIHACRLCCGQGPPEDGAAGGVRKRARPAGATAAWLLWPWSDASVHNDSRCDCSRTVGL